jgi:hypothetical protein
MKLRSIPLIPSFCSSVVATLALTMLLLEARKSCFTCRIPVTTAGYQRGGNLSRNRETARGLLSLSVAMLRRAGTKDYGIQLALSPPFPSPPPHIWQKKRRLHRRELNHSFASILVETLGSCTCMAGGGPGNNDMVMWMGK